MMTATATVDAVSTSATAPAGTVDFFAGDHYLGSAPLRDDVANLRKLVGGGLLENPVVAQYRGSDLFDESESTPVDAG